MRPTPGMSRGFILVEISVAYVILAVALVALVPMFIMALRSAKATERIVQATYLASEMLEEVRLRKWDAKTPHPARRITSPSAIGPDASENPLDKRTFDDADDFHGWRENAALGPRMEPLEAFAAYSRSVSVRYVDSALNPSAGTTNLKQVTVCAQTKNMKPVCLDTLLANR